MRPGRVPAGRMTAVGEGELTTDGPTTATGTTVVVVLADPGAPAELAVGNVAKGCHSRSGEDERTRQEYLWTVRGEVRRTAWEESGVAVKVQRRRRSQG